MKVVYPTFLVYLVTVITLFLASGVVAQDRISTEQYIETYKKTAIEKMLEYKIPASITLAQGILESGSGNSDLAKKANNHFGIKCHNEWTGKKFLLTDDAPNECFRSYKSAEESYRDHSLFLTQRERYADLFKLDIHDYKAWANGLKKAGYATNPRYPELLITIIEKYNLDEFDKSTSKKKVTPDLDREAEISYTFIPVNPSDFKVVGKSKEGRFIHSNNGIKLVFARKDESIEAIADEFDVYAYQLYKYNDLKKGHRPEKGMMIYLEKKHRRAASTKVHLLRDGESLHAVSQLYGIRLDRLYKMNKLSVGAPVKSGCKLRLR
ncbi:MAG: LysM peptidoglycan-binding domain-containing protein [Bacteroidales bacterium]|nr:LysM peptidoglycan-binding domain-containing protein [Bacteroidales bacterium]